MLSLSKFVSKFFVGVQLNFGVVSIVYPIAHLSPARIRMQRKIANRSVPMSF